MKRNSIDSGLIAAALIAAFILLFYSQFKPVYGNCHYEGPDRVCDLVAWVKK